MIRSRILLKAFAVFFIIEMLGNAIVPAVSYALTSGPMAPEASSFEPVDTSEMVDLTTGDLVYNLPLLEVPGPAGSYPVSISYHAGINPASDASWVGLGWNINTGSILRSASGYPDDWQDVDTQINESWVGGVTDRVTMGLSASWWGITLSGGIIKTKDTYKGSGRGGYSEASYGFGKKGFGAGAGVGVSYDPVGGNSVSVGAFAGVTGSGTSSVKVGVGLSVNSVFTMNGSSSGASLGVSVSANYQYISNSLIGASISSSGTTSVSVAGIGFNGGHLNNSGKITAETTSNLSGFQQAAVHANSPVFNYSDDRTKYFIKEQQSDFISGALYPTIIPGAGENYFDKHDYDVYDMFEVADGAENSANINTPKFGLANEIMIGGTLPATDNYMVMGQGTGGGIKPYDLLGTLYRKNKKNQYDKYITKQYTGGKGELPVNQSKLEFMFMNEFSNSFLYDNSGSGEYFGSNGTSLALSFNPDKVTTDPTLTDKENNNKLGRASNIEWYTNNEIKNSTANVLRANAKGLVRNSNNQVGAFKVTNPSGVTYHYALPAYTYDEEYYTENQAYDLNKEGAFKTIVKRKEKYAYAWYLTAVTGPDYVDRGISGPSSDDFGYWIVFEYGKWASDYKWRTPESGFVDDLDGNFRNYSRGKKELYYLNAIRSATHTALFIKDMRRDGKGLVTNGSANNEGEAEASFNPLACRAYPVSTLKLTKIILIENSHLPAINYTATPITCTRERTNKEGDIELVPYEVNVHHTENVLLSQNITEQQLETLEKYSIKRVDLTTDDTQMMPNTPNSFSNDNLYTSNPVAPNEKFGKLELKAIQVYGRGSESLIPPITFDYKDKTKPYHKDKTDYWGFYKSDYNAAIKDVNLRKMTTEASADSVATWSLNKIVTSLGAEINIDYESDDYEKSVLHNKVNFPVTNMTTTGDGKYTVFMDDLKGQMNERFKIGDKVTSFMVISEAKEQKIKFDKMFPPTPITPAIKIGKCADVTYFKLEKVETYLNVATIKDVLVDHLIMEVDQGEDKLAPEVPYYTSTGSSREEFLDMSPGTALTAADCNPDKTLVYYCIPVECATQHYKDFIGGEIIADLKEGTKGGGLRVKEIKLISTQSGLTYSTAYDYRNPQTGKSSGVTSYVPFKTNQLVLEYPKHYKNAVLGYFSKGSHDDTESMCPGGPIANIIKNWKEISRTILSGIVLEYVLDYYDIIGHPDRKTMAAFLGLSLNTKNDAAQNKKAELMGGLLSKINEAPSANVTYEYVTVRNKVIRDGEERENESYITNQFIVYDESMVSIHASHEKTITDVNTDAIRRLMTRGITINNFGNAVGQIKSSKVYKLDGTLLNEKVYYYLHEVDNTSDDMLDNYMNKLALYNSQGVLEETYVNARYIPFAHDFVDEEAPGPGDDPVEEKEVFSHNLVGVITKRRNLPAIMLSTETKNYQKGITTLDKTLAFDFYSGSVIKSLASDSYGNTYLSEITPAYKQYNSMHLGIKGGKHMLSQQAASYTYKVNPDNINDKIGLISASITTWSDQVSVLNAGIQTGIWRPHSGYQWGGQLDLNPVDGTYPYDDFALHPFTNWTNDANSQDKNWLKTGEITLYDPHSHSLEAKDINNNYAANRMDKIQNWVIASASNARYNEIVFAGIEDYEGDTELLGSASRGEGTTSPAHVHTGQFSLLVAPGKQGFNYTLTSDKTDLTKKYKAYAWVYVPGYAETQSELDKIQLYYTINGVEKGEAHPIIQKNKSKSWYLLDLDITPNGTDNIYIGVRNNGTQRSVYFDDFRVQPLASALTAYVYDPATGQLDFMLDGNNFYTKFEYDAIGRLLKSSKELLNYDFGQGKESFKADAILNEVKYNYGN